MADVRPAYERAAVVIAPLVASAGTNIKILEAMAMAKAIVTTPAGVNGLDVESEVVLVREPKAMAAAILELLAEPAPSRGPGAARAAQSGARFRVGRHRAAAEAAVR